jgi:methyl-accepting chemotaxis protein
MPDGRDLLRDWQDAMQSIVTAARGAAGGSELPKALMAPMQRQLELLQEVVERERKLQAEIFGRLLDPIDAVLDLLEESGKTFRAQADALEEASAALEQTAKLMQTQAEIYEGTIRALREPADLARKLAGARPKQRGSRGGRKKDTKKQS